MRWGATSTIVAVIVLTCGCGRLDFEVFGDRGPTSGRDGGSDATFDADVPDPGVDSVFRYTRTWLALGVGVPRTTVLPLVYGASGGTFSVSPALPAGMTLDPQTGAISGTPTGVSPTTIYTISLSNSASAVVMEIRVLEPLIVDSTVDSPATGSTSDGVCESVAGGCTLRAAIEESNDTPGEQLVVLPSGTYTATSTFDVTSPVAITGSDASNIPVISGGSTVRIFEMQSGADSDFLDVEIADGLASRGAGITTHQHRLRISHCVFRNNNANTTNSGAADGGAGIGSRYFDLAADWDIESTLFDSNITGSFGGGFHKSNTGTLAVRDCRFTGNSAERGAAMRIKGTSTIERSLFDGNTSGQGGVIYCASSSANTVISTSTVIDSTTERGAVYFEGGGTVQMVHTTLVNNYSSGSNPNSGGFTAGGSTASIARSVLLNNTAGGGGNNPCDASVVSLGGNVSDSTGGECGLSAPLDLEGTDVMDIGAVSLTGHPWSLWPVVQLPGGSPAIDFAEGGTGTCPEWDGSLTPSLLYGGGCDSGAAQAQ